MKPIRFILALCLALWPGLSSAETFQDILKRGDQTEVAAHLAALHQAHVAGDIEASGVRSAFAVFSTTAPHIGPFVEDWIEADPSSAYANAAALWLYHGIAWRMRGEATYEWTHPVAMEAFHRNLARAQDHAWRAFEAAPDLIAATDGVLMNEMVLKELGPFRVIDLVDTVMEVTPNRGTIYRAAATFQPKWGGNPRLLGRLCDTVADRLPTLEGYSAAVCLADVSIANSDLSGDALGRAIAVLRDHGSPRFEHHWMNLYANYRTASSVDMSPRQAADILLGEDYFHYRAAQRLYTAMSSDFYAAERDMQVDATRLILAHKDHARAALVDDPGNAEIYRMATFETRTAIDIAADSDVAMRRIMHGELLRAAPYNPDYWRAAASHYRHRSENGHWRSRLDVLGNAIAYSNHRPDILNEVLVFHLGLNTNRQTMPEGFDAALYEDEAICPAIRIARLFDAVCAYVPHNRSCAQRASQDRVRQRVMQFAQDPMTCQHEKTAPLEELVFTPVAAQVGDYSHTVGE